MIPRYVFDTMHLYQLTHVCQIATVSNNTGAHIFYGCIRGKATDTFSARQNSSPQVRAAWTMLFKQSFESMVLKVDAYIVAGLAGALRLGVGDKADRARKEIRRQINLGLGTYTLFSPYLCLLTVYLQERS